MEGRKEAEKGRREEEREGEKEALTDFLGHTQPIMNPSYGTYLSCDSGPSVKLL